MSDFGNRLRIAFSDANNTEIAGVLGVTPRAVANYIKGRVPDEKTLKLISKKTHCNLHWLLTGEGEQFVHKNTDLKILLNDFNSDELDEIEEYRQLESENREYEISYADYIKELIRKGLWQNGEEDYEIDFNEAVEKLPGGQSLSYAIRQTIVKIIQHEIFWGKSREHITNIVKSEFFEKHKHGKIEIFDKNFKIKLENERLAKNEQNTQDLGNIDEFDVEKSVRENDNIDLVLREWFEFENREYPENYGVDFGGWEKLSFTRKVETVKDLKTTLDKALEDE